MLCRSAVDAEFEQYVERTPSANPVGAVTTLEVEYTVDRFVRTNGYCISGLVGDDQFPGVRLRRTAARRRITPPPSDGSQKTVPSAPKNLKVDGGNEQVALSWDAPEDDDGFTISDYEVQVDGTGRGWTSIVSTDTTYTVTGLVNGTAYVFQVRAVNAAGNSASSNRAEATPGMGALNFAHFANGEGITSDVVLVNVALHPIGLGIYFYDKEGHLIEAESVVDIAGNLEIQEDGSLSIQTEMEPLAELTISTHGRGELVSGSVKVVSEGPIGGVLRFDLPGIGVAGVEASLPIRDALFPARRQAERISTAAAVHNTEEEAIVVTCRWSGHQGDAHQVRSILSSPSKIYDSFSWILLSALPGRLGEPAENFFWNFCENRAQV